MAENKLTVGELVYKISGDMDNLKTELTKSEASVKKLEKSMEKSTKTTGKFAKSMGVLKVAVIGFITGALVKGLKSMVTAGAELDSLEMSFRKLSSGIGEDSNEILTNLRRLSGGTISNKDLILSANRAMVLGVANDMDEFSTLMQTARLRARDMGISTTQAFDNIVTGVGRGSPLILDNLGFIVSATQAQTEYAKELGTTADKLTETQKKEALKNSILRQGNEEIERAGKILPTYKERLAGVGVAIDNLKSNIGKALLPAIESILDEFNLLNLSSEESSRKFTNFSRKLFQITNGFIAFGKVIGLIIKALTGLVAVSVEVSKSFGNTFSGFKKALKGDFKGAVAEFREGGKNIGDTAKIWGDIIKEQFESIGDSAIKLVDAEGFQASSGSMQDSLAGLAGSAEDTADSVGMSAEEMVKDLETFQGKLISSIEASKKASEELGKNLSDSFSTFGDSLKENVSESVDGLADLVIGAEDKIRDLKDQLKDTDDSDERKNIRGQIKEQESILDAREDFEERQAGRIAAIREKLESQGIDTAKAGLDNILKIRSLEEQIEEKRRLASLDEFTRFEEEQSKKLLLLTDNFISEVTVLQNKIDTQKDFENKLTEYLKNQQTQRLANSEQWAQETIAQYKGVADSLSSLISTQGQVRNIAESPATSSLNRNQVGETGNTTNNITNNNIEAPVNISGQDIQNISAEETAAILGFELNKRI